MLVGAHTTTNQQNLDRDKLNDSACKLLRPQAVIKLPFSTPSAIPPSPNEAKSNIEDNSSNVADVISDHVFVASQLNYAGQHITTMVSAGAFQNIAVDNNEEVAIENELREITAGVGFCVGIILYGYYYWRKKIWPLLQKKKNEQDNVKEKTEALKKKVISWSDRYESASMVGNQFGQSLAVLIPAPLALSNLLKLILGSTFAFFTGIILATAVKDTVEDDKEKKNIFKLGKDRWPTYTKTGMMIGALIGTLVIGVISLFLPIPIPGDIFTHLLLGAAIGSVTGYIALAAGVPLVNKLKDQSFQKKKIEDEANGEEVKKALYHSQYIRAGASLGMAIGGVIGFILGGVPPFNMIPFSNYLFSMIFSSVFGLIGSVIFGKIGPYLTRVIDPNNENAGKWYYGLRTALSYGNEIGKVSNNILRATDNNIGQMGLNNVVGGGMGLVGGVVAAVHDVYYPEKNNAANPPLFTWTKRLWIFSTIGSVIGTLIGIPFGPLGMLIGSSIGWIIGGAIGVKFGEKICEKLIKADIKFVNRIANWIGIPVEAIASPTAHPQIAPIANVPSLEPPKEPAYPPEKIKNVYASTAHLINHLNDAGPAVRSVDVVSNKIEYVTCLEKAPLDESSQLKQFKTHIQEANQKNELITHQEDKTTILSPCAAGKSLWSTIYKLQDPDMIKLACASNFKAK